MAEAHFVLDSPFKLLKEVNLIFKPLTESNKIQSVFSKL